LGRRVGAALESNECDFAGDPGRVLSNLDSRLAGVEVCSIGLGLSEANVDERILRAFSNDGRTYIDAASNVDDYNTAMAAFAKCAPGLRVEGAEGTAIDPDGVLPATRVATPSFTYDSCRDAGLTFSAGWQRGVSRPGDLHLLVQQPDGALLRAAQPLARSLTTDWDIQRAEAPAPGRWTFQLARDHTRIVNAFASDAIVSSEQGVALARRELQRLCPDGCARVLYFEDGRSDVTQPSIYAEALSAESDTGLLQSVTSFTAEDASAYAAALQAREFDLLVYVHQLDPESTAQEPYDGVLADVLCGTSVPALITDTRAPNNAESAAALFHLCSGALALSDGRNYAQLIDPAGQHTLLEGSLDLLGRGHPIHAYSVVALPLDRLGEETASDIYIRGATQLEVGHDQTALATIPGSLRSDSCAIQHDCAALDAPTAACEHTPKSHHSCCGWPHKRR
jgi:hypothetical protein